MNLDELMARGGFVPPTLVQKTVKWAEAPDGPAEFTVYVKEPSAATMERVGKSMNHRGEDPESVAQRPMMVSLCVFFDPDGKQGFPYEKACDLKHSLCTALYEAVAEVMEIGQKKAKNSQPLTSSGASSSSMESAAGQ